MEGRYKWHYRLAGLWLVLLAVGICWVCNSFRTGKAEGNDTVSVRIDSVRDTVVITKYETFPVEKEKVVTRYVSVPVIVDSVTHDTVVVEMPVVQKRYTDDSTYTAFVSGVEYEDLPRIDSIAVHQREILNTITKTITIRRPMRRWNIGLQAGYGYGFQYKGLEPYVGVGATYRIW